MSARIFVIILIAALSGTTTALGQHTPSPNGSSNEKQADSKPASTGQSTELSDEQTEKKRQLEIGMILVGGILILGVFLLVLTLLVSRRLKRTAASGRRPSQPRDELWYLKKPPAHTPPENSEGAE